MTKNSRGSIATSTSSTSNVRPDQYGRPKFKTSISAKDAYIRYTKSLLAGRHPRSFRPVTAIWDYVHTSERRRKRVRKGERLWSVIEHDASEASTSDERDELSSIASSSGSEGSPPRKSSGGLDAPMANAKARQKGIFFREEVNVLPVLNQRLEQVATGLKVGDGGKFAGTKAINADAKKSVMAADEPTAKVMKDVQYNSTPTTTLYCGAPISLEAQSSGRFLTVQWDTGQVVVSAPDAAQRGNVVVFSAIDLGQLDSYRNLKYGDSVWLQISTGSGELRWQNGSVLGSKVDHARILPTVPLDPSQECKEQELPPPDMQAAGRPVPVRAALPRTKDEVVNEKHARARNNVAHSLGRWVIRPATEAIAKKGPFVHNLDEVYLEQDQLYVSVGPTVVRKDGQPPCKEVILRQLPTLSQQKELEQSHGLRVDRHGIFRIRMSEMDRQMKGLSNEEKRNELLLRKARRNLKSSIGMRHGSRVYSDHRSAFTLLPMRGGERFPLEVRATMTDSTFFAHAGHMQEQQEKETMPHAFYDKKLRSVGANLGLCVQYSKYFTTSGQMETDYGPCRPMVRAMYSGAAQDIVYCRFHPNVRFAPPDSQPLMPARLQALALHQQYLDSCASSKASSQHSQWPSRRSTAPSATKSFKPHHPAKRRPATVDPSIAAISSLSSVISCSSIGSPVPDTDDCDISVASGPGDGVVHEACGCTSLSPGAAGENGEGLAPGFCLLCRSLRSFKLCHMNVDINSELKASVPRSPASRHGSGGSMRSVRSLLPSPTSDARKDDNRLPDSSRVSVVSPPSARGSTCPAILGSDHEKYVSKFWSSPLITSRKPVCISLPSTARHGSPATSGTGTATNTPSDPSRRQSTMDVMSVSASKLAVSARRVTMAMTGSVSRLSGLSGGDEQEGSESVSRSTRMDDRLEALDHVIKESINYADKKMKLKEFQGLYNTMLEEAMRPGTTQLVDTTNLGVHEGADLQGLSSPLSHMTAKTALLEAGGSSTVTLLAQTEADEPSEHATVFTRRWDAQDDGDMEYGDADGLEEDAEPLVDVLVHWPDIAGSVIFDEQETLRLFKHDLRLMKEKMASFLTLCASRILPRLSATSASTRSTKLLLYEVELLKQTLQVSVSAPRLSAALVRVYSGATRGLLQKTCAELDDVCELVIEEVEQLCECMVRWLMAHS